MVDLDQRATLNSTWGEPCQARLRGPHTVRATATWKRLPPAALVLLIASALASCAAPAPRISIASEQIPRHWPFKVEGSGFTPQHNVSSHLIRADGSEFPVLPILTDRDGHFTHTIDTMILELGAHELWVVDDATGRSSNRATFQVTFDYPADTKD